MHAMLGPPANYGKFYERVFFNSIISLEAYMSYFSLYEGNHNGMELWNLDMNVNADEAKNFPDNVRKDFP